MRAAELVRLFGIERRVDAAEDDGRSALARLAADLVAAQRVERMDADAHDVAARNAVEVDRIERFVDDARVAIFARRRRGEHVEPPGRDNSRAERDIAGIDEVNSHQLRTKST